MSEYVTSALIWFNWDWNRISPVPDVAVVNLTFVTIGCWDLTEKSTPSTKTLDSVTLTPAIVNSASV